VIVGAGLLGLSTAYALRGRRDVVVLEQGSVGHARGGSHGPTRIFRYGYDDPAYVRMAQSARERWSALEAATGSELLVARPQLTFGPGADAVFDALRSCGVAVERLRDHEIAHRFPAFAEHGDAILEFDSAVIRADATLAALRNGMQAELREHTTVTAVNDDGVKTVDTVLDANDVVVCAGPWSRALVPALPTRATLEHIAYVGVDEDLPIFIDFRDPPTYGLPTPNERLYKIALHHCGVGVDPAAPFAVDPDARRQVESTARAWLPDAPVVDVDVCPYDNTADEAFIIERVHGVVVGAGTSGHGFKFGPLLGEQLAALVMQR
jgi:sarcosine oxidase